MKYEKRSLNEPRLAIGNSDVHLPNVLEMRGCEIFNQTKLLGKLFAIKSVVREEACLPRPGRGPSRSSSAASSKSLDSVSAAPFRSVSSVNSAISVQIFFPWPEAFSSNPVSSRSTRYLQIFLDFLLLLQYTISWVKLYLECGGLASAFFCYSQLGSSD